MRRVTLMLAALALVGASASTAKAPATWDGLIHVKSKKVAALYLLPNADFRAYSQVMFDPPQIAFQKNWEQDFNLDTMTLANRVTDSDVRNDVNEAQKYAAKVFPEAFTQAGFQVASAPSANVLRLSVYVLNITISAPQSDMSLGQSYAADAGSATLAVEARDSLTNQLLGRVVDPQLAGDEPGYQRTQSSNRADFEELFKHWAKVSAAGLTTLKAESPVNTDGIRKQ